MNVSKRLQENVEGIKVLDFRQVMQWQYQTPSWSMLSYGEMAEELGVERVVFIELYEFRRLPPEGNSYLWDGACAATLGVIEEDGWDPDSFAKTWEIGVKFPDIQGVGRESANAVADSDGPDGQVRRRDLLGLLPPYRGQVSRCDLTRNPSSSSSVHAVSGAWCSGVVLTCLSPGCNILVPVTYAVQGTGQNPAEHELDAR